MTSRCWWRVALSRDSDPRASASVFGMLKAREVEQHGPAAILRSIDRACVHESAVLSPPSPTLVDPIVRGYYDCRRSGACEPNGMVGGQYTDHRDAHHLDCQLPMVAALGSFIPPAADVPLAGDARLALQL